MPWMKPRIDLTLEQVVTGLAMMVDPVPAAGLPWWAN